MNEWISVDDQLPEYGLVIASTDDYKLLGRVSVPAYYDSVIGHWYDAENIDRDGDREILFCVTHWIPIPRPPESSE